MEQKTKKTKNKFVEVEKKIQQEEQKPKSISFKLLVEHLQPSFIKDVADKNIDPDVVFKLSKKAEFTFIQICKEYVKNNPIPRRRNMFEKLVGMFKKYSK